MDKANPHTPDTLASEIPVSAAQGLLEEKDHDSDVEMGLITHSTSSSAPRKMAPAEHGYTMTEQLVWLAGWFFANLVLTIHNKTLLGQASYPWLLTSVHTTMTTIGCFGMLSSGLIRLTKLGTRENLIMLGFSFLFTINIAVSNIGLGMISVPLNQILRSLCPIITIIMVVIIDRRTYSTTTYLSMIPVMIGVSLATMGDLSCTLLGLFLNLLGVWLSAVKTIVTNKLMTGSLAIPALELLLRMCPLAALQCLVFAAMSGEVSRFHGELVAGNFPTSFFFALLVNGTIAFMLNVVSFQANKVSGALTMSVAGNLKQTLTILLGYVWFQLVPSALGLIGTVVTIAGAVWYSKVEMDNKNRRTT